MMQKEIVIKITDISEGDFSSREEGRDVLVLILKWWKRVEKIIFDFDYVQVASTSFIDEVFGTLALHFSNEELKAKLKLENIDPIDKRMINATIADRRRELEALSSSE